MPIVQYHPVDLLPGCSWMRRKISGDIIEAEWRESSMKSWLDVIRQLWIETSSTKVQVEFVAEKYLRA